MNPDNYVKQNLIKSLIAVPVFVGSMWFLITCFLVTLHVSFSNTQFPIINVLGQLPAAIFQYTNVPVVNIAWKYAVPFPSPSDGLLSENMLVLIGAALVCGLSGGFSGNYFRAKSEVAGMRRQVKKQQLKRGVEEQENPGSPESREKPKTKVPSNIKPKKTWDEKWWGKVLIGLTIAIIGALLLKGLGIKA
ncbi:hypothetical protein P3695_24165 [Vibrio parahaemolyticus]|nr:hypothetical protein [Vibrio parahaemolyticus]